MKRPVLWRQATAASAALWVWAAHFAVSYVAVALGCDAGWHERGLPGWPSLSWLQLALAAAAVLAAAALLALAWRDVRRPSLPGLESTLRRLGLLLALAGIAWVALPVALLPPCRFA